MVEDVATEDLVQGEDYKRPEGTCMAGNGQLFSTTKQGIIPQLIKKLYTERTSFKDAMLYYKNEADNLGQDTEFIERRILAAMSIDNQEGLGGSGDSTIRNDNHTEKAAKIQDFHTGLDREPTKLDKKVASLDTKQLALKILMNTLYGALSNEYFRYFDPRIAEGVTLTGQYVIRSAEKVVNEWMNKKCGTKRVDYVVAIDTDSLYINFGPFVKKHLANKSKTFILDTLDKDVAPRLEGLFKETFESLQEKTGCKINLMKMKREVIADKGIWTGKKHYMLSVLDSEQVRYKEPQIKMMGIEAVRSSTPNIFRKLIKKTIKTIMTKDEKAVQDLIREERDKILDLKYAPEDVAFPRGVSNMDKYKDRSSIYRKATPIHVRGALLYNYFLTQHNLDKKYEKIFSGDKIKFLYLKLPNRVKENVIAFNGTLPEEFRVKEHIDYDLQFDKGYLEPIKSILETIGWDTEKRATLEDFF